MLVLGIETSCDETGVAVVDTHGGLKSEALYSQAHMHAMYGGVVPEIASRDHVRRLVPLIRQVLNSANISRPDSIAYTAGPGLVGALMVGAGIANGLALGWDCPVIKVHHMEGHLVAPMLDSERPEFPFLALLVSGGHTMLVWAESLGKYSIIGNTLDDAVGEAFDKTAKLLGLGYPGGPQISRIAESGNDNSHVFPRPMKNKPGFDFSFSGLKTAVMLKVKELEENKSLELNQSDLAASFQRAAVDTLVYRTLKAAAEIGSERLVVSGGVSANKLLRKELDSNFKGTVYYPDLKFCTDNGAMIALAGALRLNEGIVSSEICASARWSLEDLSPPEIYG